MVSSTVTCTATLEMSTREMVSVVCCTGPGRAQKPGLGLGFAGLGPIKIVSPAHTVGLGWAWAGLGLGSGLTDS